MSFLTKVEFLSLIEFVKMAKTWIECFQEAKIIAGAGRQPCKSWVTGLWPDFEEAYKPNSRIIFAIFGMCFDGIVSGCLH